MKRRRGGRPADDLGVFAYLVEAAAAMFAVICPAPTPGRRTGEESVPVQEVEIALA